MATDQTPTTAPWGWNGDMCAVWGQAIMIGETRLEKETRAQLFAAAPDLLAALKWFINDLSAEHSSMAEFDDNVARAERAIAKAEGNENV